MSGAPEPALAWRLCRQRLVPEMGLEGQRRLLATAFRLTPEEPDPLAAEVAARYLARAGIGALLGWPLPDANRGHQAPPSGPEGALEHQPRSFSAPRRGGETPPPGHPSLAGNQPRSFSGAGWGVEAPARDGGEAAGGQPRSFPEADRGGQTPAAEVAVALPSAAELDGWAAEEGPLRQVAAMLAGAMAATAALARALELPSEPAPWRAAPCPARRAEPGEEASP